MNNSKDINISNFLDTSWKAITDYFINTQININNNDDYKTKFEKFLLKYKRIIGLVLLIILLIIGYYYYTYNNYNNDANIIQKGGGSETPAAAPATAETAAAAPAAAPAPAPAPALAAAAEPAADKKKGIGDYKKEAIDKKAISKLAKVDASKAKYTAGKASLKKAIGKSAGNIKAAGTGLGMSGKKGAVARYATGAVSKGVSGSISAVRNVGAAGAQSIRENADWFYGMLYAVAISLVVCIITIPSIAFFICGLICYVLLKNNMKAIKSF